MAQAKKSMRHASGKKAARQAVRRSWRNRAVKKQIRLSLRRTLESAKDPVKSAEIFSKTASAIDKAARKGVIHWKAAARKKSRLAQRLKAAQAVPQSQAQKTPAPAPAA